MAVIYFLHLKSSSTLGFVYSRFNNTKILYSLIMYSMFALDDILITNIILNKNRATLKHICIYPFNTFAVNYNVFLLQLLLIWFRTLYLQFRM